MIINMIMKLCIGHGKSQHVGLCVCARQKLKNEPKFEVRLKPFRNTRGSKALIQLFIELVHKNVKSKIISKFF